MRLPGCLRHMPCSSLYDYSSNAQSASPDTPGAVGLHDISRQMPAAVLGVGILSADAFGDTRNP